MLDFYRYHIGNWVVPIIFFWLEYRSDTDCCFSSLCSQHYVIYGTVSHDRIRWVVLHALLSSPTRFIIYFNTSNFGARTKKFWFTMELGINKYRTPFQYCSYIWLFYWTIVGHKPVQIVLLCYYSIIKGCPINIVALFVSNLCFYFYWFIPVASIQSFPDELFRL